MRAAIFSWRGRAVVDAYAQMPNGEARNKDAIEPYVEIVRARGHSLPKNAEHIGNTMRDEIHRLSSSSRVYRNPNERWSAERPDIFRKIEEGRWGLRPSVFAQVRGLELDAGDILAGSTPLQPAPAVFGGDLFGDDNDLHRQKLYLMEMIPPAGTIFPNGMKLIKIGIGHDPHQRKNELQTGNPGKLLVRMSIECRAAPQIERKLHGILVNKRMEGEWFMADINDYEQIGLELMRHSFA